MCLKVVIGDVVPPDGRHRSAHDRRVVAWGADAAAVAVVTLIHLPRHSPLFL